VTVADENDPALVLGSVGPATDTIDQDGRVATTRTGTITEYDYMAPNNGIAPDTGLPYRLPVSSFTLVRPIHEWWIVPPTKKGLLRDVIEVQEHVTLYDPEHGGASGWDLRAPTVSGVSPGGNAPQRRTQRSEDLLLQEVT